MSKALAGSATKAWQNVEDKPWKHVELRKLEEALPRLKERRGQK